MTYESKSFKEHHLTRLPVLERLLLLGWEREQIICPSPNSDDTEWHVPKTPSEATNRESKNNVEILHRSSYIFWEQIRIRVRGKG